MGRFDRAISESGRIAEAHVQMGQLEEAAAYRFLLV